MTARVLRPGSSTISATKQRSQPEVGCVYLITSPSRKQYVGQTVRSLDERWREHVREAANGAGDCRALANAIRKYGPEALDVRILHKSSNQDELNALEAREIAERRTLSPRGYNLKTGGANGRHSTETCKRMSIAHQSRYADPAERNAQAARVKARYTDPAERLLQSVRQKARYSDPAERERQSKRQKAHWADPTKRRTQSERLKTRFSDPAERLAHSERQKVTNRAKVPNVFAEGQFFPSLAQAQQALISGDACYRVRSTDPRWRWWHTIPNHNDPECDAVEECWAVIQWAEANPDHANVPAWVRRRA